MHPKGNRPWGCAAGPVPYGTNARAARGPSQRLAGFPRIFIVWIDQAVSVFCDGYAESSRPRNIACNALSDCGITFVSPVTVMKLESPDQRGTTCQCR
ncbi:hypothetical protein Pan189_15400 [Stratiformator vulcanicus]|uniref:Uncharacterized protein n=1 Tax=Stratiformator vulcanicus TaxID=2527980 RepID=A0A517QZX8_9PLAN|nr:hypothetical protein Pan189_15400 [Stratiformator vulcanicus]